MLVLHYLPGFSIKWIFSKEFRFCFCSSSPQTKRRQGKISWGSMVTPDWAPQVRSRRAVCPTNSPHIHCQCILTKAVGLCTTEPWDFVLQIMFWASKRFIMQCSAEEPGGTLLDRGEISMEESQKSMQYSQKKREK